MTSIVALHSYYVKAVFCGGAHTAALSVDHRMYTWGLGTSGQLGHGDMASRLVPTEVSSLLGVSIARVSLGQLHSACVTYDGMVFTWGLGELGALLHEFETVAKYAVALKLRGVVTLPYLPFYAYVPCPFRSLPEPTLVKSFVGLDAFDVACGHAHTLVLTDQHAVSANYQAKALTRHKEMVATCRAAAVRHDKQRRASTMVRAGVRLRQRSSTDVRRGSPRDNDPASLDAYVDHHVSDDSDEQVESSGRGRVSRVVHAKCAARHARRAHGSRRSQRSRHRARQQGRRAHSVSPSHGATASVGRRRSSRWRAVTPAQRVAASATADAIASAAIHRAVAAIVWGESLAVGLLPAGVSPEGASPSAIDAADAEVALLHARSSPDSSATSWKEQHPDRSTSVPLRACACSHGRVTLHLPVCCCCVCILCRYAPLATPYEQSPRYGALVHRYASVKQRKPPEEFTSAPPPVAPNASPRPLKAATPSHAKPPGGSPRPGSPSRNGHLAVVAESDSWASASLSTVTLDPQQRPPSPVTAVKGGRAGILEPAAGVRPLRVATGELVADVVERRDRARSPRLALYDRTVQLNRADAAVRRPSSTDTVPRAPSSLSTYGPGPVDTASTGDTSNSNRAASALASLFSRSPRSSSSDAQVAAEVSRWAMASGNAATPRGAESAAPAAAPSRPHRPGGRPRSAAVSGSARQHRQHTTSRQRPATASSPRRGKHGVAAPVATAGSWRSRVSASIRSSILGPRYDAAPPKSRSSQGTCCGSGAQGAARASQPPQPGRGVPRRSRHLSTEPRGVNQPVAPHSRPGRPHSARIASRSGRRVVRRVSEGPAGSGGESGSSSAGTGAGSSQGQQGDHASSRRRRRVRARPHSAAVARPSSKQGNPATARRRSYKPLYGGAPPLW